MGNILTIARRETKRFRSRFSGGSKWTTALAILLALVVSFLVFQQGLVISKGLYTIGVSPDGPAVDDGRFHVLTLDRASGYGMLKSGEIDLYMDGDTAVLRPDDRSQYAASALKKYLDSEELGRIRSQYQLDTAFPLRISVSYISASDDDFVWPPPEVTPTITPSIVADSDAAVLDQIARMENGSFEFKARFINDNEILVPSLMTPPMPLAQVLIAFLYIVPIFFISIFFNSSIMDEKTNRKLNVLLSAPVKPFDIIAGKMLPYLTISLIMVTAITLVLKGDVLLALAIFTPIILFIFAIYLMVALVYRTFKDQTFFQMAAITFVTGYLVLPSILAGSNPLSYISPLTLAVQMYRGESFGINEYLVGTIPMYLTFLISMYAGVRIFNEEYLMGFGPLYRKAADALYLSISKSRPYLSVFLISALCIPVVFIIQLIILVLAINVPWLFSIAILMIFLVIVEEIAKSAGIMTLIERGHVNSYGGVLALAAASAVGFLIGEKLLLFITLSVISNLMLVEALMDANLLFIPLIAHFVFTSIVCLSAKKLGTKYYIVGLLGGSLVHYVYNMYIIMTSGAM